jgi:GWxTD domain-containing protein
MNTPIVNALAAALFHFLWEGAALALMLAVALLIFRQAQARYVAACAALLAMPLAFVVTLALLYPHTLTFSNLVLLPEQTALIASSPATVPPANSFQDYMRWFVPVWFAGIALFYIRSVGSWIGVVRLRRIGVSAATPEWQDRVTQLASRLRVDSVVTLFESRLVDVPVVAGFLRPVILMPAGFLAGMPPEQLEYLLIHELAHVRRLDYFVNLLQKAVEGLLFYHPAVWWVSSVMAKERENCCDDVVLSIHPEPGRYASTLAALEQSRWSAAPAANGGNLSQRIGRILNRPERSHVAHTPALATVLLAISVALVFAALQRPAPAAQAQTLAQELATPWKKWLNEDVVYIIEDQERRALINLTTDEEREKFVEQFWERRNPVPGSPINQFKEEHYRRINFANGRFASPTVPGWKTDRGRIYITFGPPNEIDSHPSCSTSTPAYDEWGYRYIEGIGNNVQIRFADAACTGEYRMTMDPAIAK